MKCIVLLATLVCAAAAQATTLDELLAEIHAEQVTAAAENAARVARFREARDAQREMLEAARSRVTDATAAGDALREHFNANQERLAEQQRVLDDTVRDLGELHGVVRQVAGEVAASVADSLASVAAPDRALPATRLTNGSDLPRASEIEALWELMLDEMVASHRIDTVNALVIDADGVEGRREVTRIGPFTAYADGDFLRFLGESGQLLAPARQPPANLRAHMQAFSPHAPGVQLAVIDPTGGALVTLLGRRADLPERVRQGGIVGYVILALGAGGMLLALMRYAALLRLGRRMHRDAEHADETQPLARLSAAARVHAADDAETLGLHLDEVILGETPRLQRGIGFLAMLAGIAPLLGLLGTVTGIIETFQAITLYGTGDPQLMSSGISQALVTTVMGLVVAIPMFLLHNLLSERSNALVGLLDAHAAGLIAARAARHDATS